MCIYVLAEALEARRPAWRIGWLVGSGALLLTLDWVFARSVMVS